MQNQKVRDGARSNSISAAVVIGELDKRVGRIKNFNNRPDLSALERRRWQVRQKRHNVEQRWSGCLLVVVHHITQHVSSRRAGDAD
jgi:hypothetical protein